MSESTFFLALLRNMNHQPICKGFGGPDMGKTMHLNRVGNNGTAPAEGAFAKKRCYLQDLRQASSCVHEWGCIRMETTF